MEIRVGVDETNGAERLLDRLAPRFGHSSIARDRGSREIVVSVASSAQASVEVIEGVQSWLAAEGAGSETLSFGQRSVPIVEPGMGTTAGGGSR